jgi:hypothetical protein
MDDGQFIHTATLEPVELHKRFALIPQDGLDKKEDGSYEFRSANNKSIRDAFIQECENKGITAILKPQDWQDLVDTSGAVLKLECWKPLFENAEKEKEFTWINEIGVAMKAKLDLLNILGDGKIAVIGDIKKMPDISIEEARRTIKNRLINAQLAIYEEAVRYNYPEVETFYHIVLACEKGNNIAVAYQLPENYNPMIPSWQDISIETGGHIYNECVVAYKDCCERYGNPWDDNVIWPGPEYWSKSAYGLIEL